MLTISTPPQTTYLSTLQAIRDAVGVTTADADSRLDGYLSSGSDLIERTCRRSFGRGVFVETLKGYGTMDLVVSRRPVVAVSQVLIDSVVDAGWTIEDGPSGILSRASSLWPDSSRLAAHLSWVRDPVDGLRNISVTYTAGYLLPGDNLIERTDISATALTKTLTRASGVWPLLVAGDRITVAGFKSSTNTGTFTVVTRTSSTVTVAEALADEAAGPVVTVLVQTLPARLERAVLLLAKTWEQQKDRDPDLLARRVGDLEVRYRERAQAELGSLPGDVLQMIISDIAEV